MFKITNKQTGFKQYRNSKETADFVFKNDYNKYTIEFIPTNNTEKTEKILENFFYGVSALLLFLLSYVLLWTV